VTGVSARFGASALLRVPALSVGSFLFLRHSAMIILRQSRCAFSRPRHIVYFHASPAWWVARKVLQRFKLADIGEGITECEVIKWYVSCT
jgi:hypothetical protein